MHNAFMPTVAGRLASRYRYSMGVYNHFPRPEHISDKDKAATETQAQAVLEARAAYPEARLPSFIILKPWPTNRPRRTGSLAGWWINPTAVQAAKAAPNG